MTITTKIKEVNEGNVKAVCTVIIDEKLYIKNFRIMQTKDGKNTFVSFPSVKNKEGGYVNSVFCANREYYDALCEKILKDYNVSRETTQDTKTDLPL